MSGLEVATPETRAIKRSNTLMEQKQRGYVGVPGGLRSAGAASAFDELRSGSLDAQKSPHDAAMRDQLNVSAYFCTHILRHGKQREGFGSSKVTAAQQARKPKQRLRQLSYRRPVAMRGSRQQRSIQHVKAAVKASYTVPQDAPVAASNVKLHCFDATGLDPSRKRVIRASHQDPAEDAGG